MARSGFDEVVLLTGFPSFRARAVCAELLASPRTYVHAIVLPKLAAEAAQALAALPEASRSRLNLIDGDVASLDMGLSGAEWHALCSEVDIIHHAASITYLGIQREVAAHVNINGAREVLEFAANTKDLRAFVMHSTAHVAGDRRGVVLESELRAGQRFANAVEETWARAELIVQKSSDRVPIVVLRPATLICDSRTGEVDRLDGPYFLIQLILTSPPDVALPLPGGGELPLHVVPVDFVARAACAIGRDPRAIGATFHLVDPAPQTARQFFELVAAAGGRAAPRGAIPANLTAALLRTPGLERFAKSPRAFVDSLVRPVTFDSTNTARLLAGSGISCPSLETYVDKLVSYAQQRITEKKRRPSESAILAAQP